MDLSALLGEDAESLLGHTCKGVTAQQIMAPGPDFFDRSLVATALQPPSMASSTMLAGSK